MAIIDNSTGYSKLPSGTTAQRPASPSPGMIRINTTTGYLEVYIFSSWTNVKAMT